MSYHFTDIDSGGMCENRLPALSGEVASADDEAESIIAVVAAFCVIDYCPDECEAQIQAIEQRQ